MRMKISIGIGILILAGIIAVSVIAVIESKETANKINSGTGKENLIQVSNLKSGQFIRSPLTITGQARGTWYFEASFPVQVLDKDGNILAAVPAQTQSDWMTENFVLFKANFKITTPYTGPATLLLKKDNPSGIPEKDASISFPINIQ